MQICKPRVRQVDVLTEELQGERVVYDNGNKQIHRLNATMSRLWNHCDGTRTIDDLIAALQTDMGDRNARDLIIDGLNQLADANLLDPGSFGGSTFSGHRIAITRRAAVTAGVSIAVPMMTSILAPTPAAAKSHPDKDTNGNNQNKPAKKR